MGKDQGWREGKGDGVGRGGEGGGWERGRIWLRTGRTDAHSAPEQVAEKAGRG